MIKITNYLDGKKYELVPTMNDGSCDGCAMKGKPTVECRTQTSLWGRCVCVRLNGIWKEVKDAD